jgi:hypothetical protein
MRKECTKRLQIWGAQHREFAKLGAMGVRRAGSSQEPIIKSVPSTSLNRPVLSKGPQATSSGFISLRRLRGTCTYRVPAYTNKFPARRPPAPFYWTFPSTCGSFGYSGSGGGAQ